MNELEKVLRDGGLTKWKDILAQEGHLIPLLMMYQRSMILAKVIPSWEVWEDSKAWFEIKPQLDSTDARKFKAWWELLREVQRFQDDGQAVQLALMFIIQEQAVRSYGKKVPINGARHGFTDPVAIEKVLHAVLTRIEDLLPREVAAGADLAGMTRLKFDKRNGKRKR